MRRWLLYALIWAGILSGLAGLGLYSYYLSPGPMEAPVTVILPKGGVQGTAATLSESGVVAWPLAFKIVAVASGQHKKLKAGEYIFEPGMSPKDVLGKLVRGEVVIRKFTVPEGLSAWEVVERLKAEAAMTGEITALPQEGSLLPETYHFAYGDDRAALLARMAQDHEKTLNALWASRQENLPWKTPAEAVIAASIVEKETGHVEERDRVASVFANRLRIGMKLQSDPTVIYGITSGKGPLGRDLTRADLERDTPYNTYTREGLTPGPIANPGKASLEAVLNPPVTKDLYFVATGQGDGRHFFAESLEEHNRNVTRYRLTQRKP
ncbi:MAG: endolytic transglycosylase MltG [Alphaproteobacteria bacterium]|nr:endolytic transglycosylase MltG [Alphaproteobacteria bacterium]